MHTCNDFRGWLKCTASQDMFHTCMSPSAMSCLSQRHRQVNDQITVQLTSLWITPAQWCASAAVGGMRFSRRAT